MPCNSDYLEPTRFEKNLSEVIALQEELKTGKLPKYYGTGWIPDSNGGAEYATGDLDEEVESLCSKLQQVDKAGLIREFSLELQMWWRNHQKADAIRISEDLKKAKDDEARLKALSKLSDYERKLLGL